MPVFLVHGVNSSFRQTLLHRPAWQGNLLLTVNPLLPMLGLS